MSLKPTWSGRLRRARNLLAKAIGVALVLLAVRVGWHLAERDDARALLDGRSEADLVGRRDYLAAHVDQAEHTLAPKESQFAGEWAIVTLAMTALAAGNIGFEHSETVPTDLELAGRCVELARSKDARAFDAGRWGDDALDALDGPHAHAGYLGELALTLEAYRLLGGHDADTLALEARVIGVLAGKLEHATSGLLATYPDESYVADSAVVLAALALSDVGRGAKTSGAATTAKAPHAALLSKTLATWRASLVDGPTGVLVFGDGPRKQPRASGAAFSAMMLGWVDEAFAQTQAKALFERFDDRVLHLFPALCENPGCSGGGDVDSGPLVFGASPSATGFAIALAKRAGDEPRLDGLLATAEWAGLTFAWSGRKRYLLAPLVGDAVVLAAKSARAWDVRYL